MRFEALVTTRWATGCTTKTHFKNRRGKKKRGCPVLFEKDMSEKKMGGQAYLFLKVI